MMSSSNQPVPVPSRGRPVLLAVVLVFVLVGVIFLAIRHRTVIREPLPEVHRKNLELRAGSWFAPGQTNGFTGLLFDTYDDGAMKSRSAVSNGLLQGLSEGWHTNGQQQVEEHFVAGTSHGLRTKWHPNGQMLSEVPVVEGKLSGTFRSWHENGERAEEVELKDGQPDGLSRAWFPSGYQKSQVTLQNGKVVEQKFWKDGEFKEAAATGPGLVSGN
ncbi:MAG: toxin-antitoxin system YwqK family antitoxin [Verrucomicrobia bacterium]|nr:toxin-antitoxin system YwqK family antitoxin [Verrucomicrobiota bacterium]